MQPTVKQSEILSAVQYPASGTLRYVSVVFSCHCIYTLPAPMKTSTKTHIRARGYGVVENTPKGDAIRVSASCFLEYISPPLHPSIDVEEIIRNFKSGAKVHRKVITGGNRWRGFAQDPAQLGDREQSCFRPLEDVLKAITKATGMHSSVQLKTNPQGGVLRPYRDTNSLPDAYLVLDCPSGRPPGWMDIAVSGEYRNNGTAGDTRVVSFQLIQRVLG